jgi:hypothetical protein
LLTSGTFAGQKLTVCGLLAQDEIGFAPGVSIIGSFIIVGGKVIGTFAVEPAA